VRTHFCHLSCCSMRACPCCACMAVVSCGRDGSGTAAVRTAAPNAFLLHRARMSPSCACAWLWKHLEAITCSVRLLREGGCCGRAEERRRSQGENILWSLLVCCLQVRILLASLVPSCHV
jgi:hypothetical protein